MTEFKINVETKDNEVVVRTGAAAPLHEPISMNFTGFLYSPGDYMKNKKGLVEANDCRLEVDYENMSLTFLVNARDKFRDQISGKLVPSKIIQSLGVNVENRFYGDKQLAKLLRRNAMYFGDQSAGSSLIHRLMNFEAKITTNIIAKDDLKGNTKKAIEKAIENELPDFFVLDLPVFEGAEPQPIKIYLLADTSGNGVLLYLDSPDLYILEQTESKRLIDLEIKRFEEFGCAIIRK